MKTIHQGDFYNKTNYWQSDRWEDLVELLNHALVNKEAATSLLDVGCGSGKLSKRLLEVFPSVKDIKAVDVSTTMLETARRENAHEAIKYLEIAAEKVDSLNQTFDIIHSNFVLHWVENKDTFFKALDKISQQGTYFMLGTCQNLPSLLLDIDILLRKAFKVPENTPAPFHYFDIQQWTEILKRYGWKVEAVSVRYDHHYTGDVEEYVNHWVSASTQKICYGHWFEDMLASDKANMMKFLLDKYQYNDENSFIFHEETLLLIARKL